ncbi:MAG: TolC family protein [Acidobacteriota bacterium]
MRRSLLVGLTLLLGLMRASGQAASDAILDPVNSMTVDDLVRLAMQHNGEFLATQQQIAVSHGGVTQARLRPNPSFQVNGAHEVAGSQNNIMLGGTLPLELYHRRDRRIEVATVGLTMAEFDQAEQERQLRSEIEMKFGDVLASLRNLQFTEELLTLNRKALDLVTARVEQGATAPLDANLLRVEVNRIDSQRVEFEAKLGVDVLELKSLVGMKSQEIFHIKGTLEPEAVTITQEEALKHALETRPDLLAARAGEQVASARLKQAQTEARPDASVSASYQRMNSSFAQNGLTASGQVQPIQGVFHFLSMGVSITLPVRNRNEGAIETAVAEVEQAKQRREYAELIATREIAAAFLVQAKARESLQIYSDGVRGQAAQNLEVIRKVNELGRTPLQDVIAGQRRFVEIETGYTDVLNRNYQASVRLRTATGLMFGR